MTRLAGSTARWATASPWSLGPTVSGTHGLREEIRAGAWGAGAGAPGGGLVGGGGGGGGGPGPPRQGSGPAGGLAAAP
jgi:hypothetical protein